MLVYMRQAQNNDLVAIVAIIEAARFYLRQQGINQWQLGYPNQETILNDLNQKMAMYLLPRIK